MRDLLEIELRACGALWAVFWAVYSSVWGWAFSSAPGWLRAGCNAVRSVRRRYHSLADWGDVRAWSAA